MIASTPSPSRLRLDTSPPEEGRGKAAAETLLLPLPPERGERCRAEGETERGDDDRPSQASRSRREAGTTTRARQLRQAGNQAEALLWEELKNRRLGGYRFVRQFPIGPFFADFACRSEKLVVEIDGSQHAAKRSDRVRDSFMNDRGYAVIRLWTVDVLRARTSVCETILAALNGKLTENVIAPDLRFTTAARTEAAP